MTSLRVAFAFAVVITLLSLLAPTHASPQEAARLRRQGEEAMLKRDYKQSINYFTQLIDLEATPRNRYKRATVAFRQQNYPACVDDMNIALESPSLSKADSDAYRLLRVQARLNLGLCSDAQADIPLLPPTQQTESFRSRASACVTADRQLSGLAQRHRVDLSQPRFAQLSRLHASSRAQLARAIDESLKHGAPANTLLHMRSLLLLLSGEPGKVITLTAAMAADNLSQSGAVATPSRADYGQVALMVRSVAYFLMGESTASLGYAKKALRDDPENKPFKAIFKALKKAERIVKNAESAAAQDDWADALETHLDALRDHPQLTTTVIAQLDAVGAEGPDAGKGVAGNEAAFRLNAKHCNLHLRAARTDEARAGAAVTACDGAQGAWRALAQVQGPAMTQGGDTEVLLDRAECLLIASRLEDAVKAYQMLLQRDQQNARAREGMEKAQARIKQTNSKDYYKILGVSRQAKKKDLKKAFHKLAKQYHPDMVSEEDKEAAQRKFQDISEAYEVLGDDQKRSKFDRGEDVFGNDPQPQRNPFGGHPGFGHPFGGGRGGPRFSFRFG